MVPGKADNRLVKGVRLPSALAAIEQKQERRLRRPMPAKVESILECSDIWKVFGVGANRLSSLSKSQFDAAIAAGTSLVPAVREVTLSVDRGECFCIMGLSGSGKSTLVRCMTGLLPLSRGRLKVLGTELSHASAVELVALRRHKMSMVFQDFALLPHLTVLENVAFPLRVQGMKRAQREERALELVRLIGLEGRETYYPHELSGGQQQRVGIARSLTTNPELWFLDEPFSALDPLIRQDMQDELLRLQAMLQKTVVFITHDFDEAVRLATRIAIMRDASIVQIDTPEGLVLRPADDYVARFTGKVALAEVVRVGSIATFGLAADSSLEPVAASALVKEVAARVLESNRPLPVVDAQGQSAGVITPKAIADALLRRLPGRLP